MFLPALQPVATRLRELHVSDSCLQGSADGFLTKGWNALTSLTLTSTLLEDAKLTAALQLPVVEEMQIRSFSWRAGMQGWSQFEFHQLQLHQLTHSCTQVSRLVFLLDTWRSTEPSQQRFSLQNLNRLADLHAFNSSKDADVDLDLPPSLTQLHVQGSTSFFWALHEAVKCVRRGAQLHKLICGRVEVRLQPAQWGASLDEQHNRLGGQLGSLRELKVWGVHEQLLSTVCAVASAAPSLVRLEIVMQTPSWSRAPRREVLSICSASLKNIRMEWQVDSRPVAELPPLQVLLMFLPGCTQLQEVIVQIHG